MSLETRKGGWGRRSEQLGKEVIKLVGFCFFLVVGFGVFC